MKFVTQTGRIISMVSEQFGVSIKDIEGPRRFGDIVRARHSAMWLARKTTVLSFPQIAKAFKRKDHTTVKRAVEAVDRAMEREPVYAATMMWLLDEVSDGKNLDETVLGEIHLISAKVAKETARVLRELAELPPDEIRKRLFPEDDK